jgi:hypothetical protein
MERDAYIRLKNEFIPLYNKTNKQTNNNNNNNWVQYQLNLIGTLQIKKHADNSLFPSTYMNRKNIGNRYSQPAMPLPNNTTTNYLKKMPFLLPLLFSTACNHRNS